MTPANVEELDWQKSGGLLPAIAQDVRDGRVLMVGFVNRQALLATHRAYVIEQGRVVHEGRSEDLVHDPVIVDHYLGQGHQAG